MACFDLFHSTSGIVSACDLDAQACQDAAAQEEATAGDAGTDFCGFTPALALANAQHACAWLGACETPMGSNAFGTCMFDALLAYDCSANPNHAVRGKAHALWDCLWQVNNCADVTRCVFPGGPLTCSDGGVDFTSCGNDGLGQVQANASVRIECSGNGSSAVGENCALIGQTCASSGAGAVCAGDSPDAGCIDGCIGGSHVSWCGSDGVDVGLDCASNGAGACGGFPTAADAGWVACLPGGVDVDASCTPTLQVSCTSDGYASSCPAGVPESVYCPDLLQTSSGTVCVAGPLLPPFDWTSACTVPGGCTADSCDGDGGVVGCARGATYPLDCFSQGLGPCKMVNTDVGTATHAACTPM